MRLQLAEQQDAASNWRKDWRKGRRKWRSTNSRPEGVQLAKDGDHSDGGGLMLRVQGNSSSWVLRFTSPAGKRREMGLGPSARGSAAQAGDSLKGARALAHAACELLRCGTDPIDEREGRRQAERVRRRTPKRAAKARESLTWHGGRATKTCEPSSPG